MHKYEQIFYALFPSKSSCPQGHVGSNPTHSARWMRVGVLNSFLRLSNTPTLVLWEKALLFQAFSFLMCGPPILSQR